MTWGELFDRAPDGLAVTDVRRALAERRDADGERPDGKRETDDGVEP